MCFNISTKYLNAKIADKDIVCYKTGRPKWYGFQSYHQNYRYMRWRRNKKINIKPDVYGDIDPGYHSFKEKQNTSYESVFEMVIPKGTRYFENESYYVSERIKYIKKCK